jgi:glucose/arabinose dehydrogenase
MKKIIRSLLFTLSAITMGGCSGIRHSQGGQIILTDVARTMNPNDIAIPYGYKIEMVASGLTFPTAMAFDENGGAYVIEAGSSSGDVAWEPKLLRIEDGKATLVATGSRNGPWTGLTYFKGKFYVAEGGKSEGGKILQIAPTGEIKVLLDQLPSLGDHTTNGLVIINNYIYFGQGTATNSGIAGEDNAQFGWLRRRPEFHDIPCRDIILTGINYQSDNVLTDNVGDKANTGAFQSYNTPTQPGQLISGSLPCSGSIMRIPIEGGPVELVAWGFRNPSGLAVYDRKLYATENGFDNRGSRPVEEAADVLWEVKPSVWYGWPDFSSGKPLSQDQEFKKQGNKNVESLLQSYPNTPPLPLAILGIHSSPNGLDFSHSDKFGFVGDAFVAEFGNMAIPVGKVRSHEGYKVVRVNMRNGVDEDFATNKGKLNGPASGLKKQGLERPISVRFDTAGENLYIVDYGIVKMSDLGPKPLEKTGVIWKISKPK